MLRYAINGLGTDAPAHAPAQRPCERSNLFLAISLGIDSEAFLKIFPQEQGLSLCRMSNLLGFLLVVIMNFLFCIPLSVQAVTGRFQSNFGSEEALRQPEAQRHGSPCKNLLTFLYNRVNHQSYQF